jgi:transcription-repair coupling factor (superfamily II helicase)
VPPGAEALAPLLQPALETVFDFLPEDTLVLVDDPDTGRDRLLRHAGEMLENFDVAVEGGRVVCPPDQIALPADELVERVEARRPVQLERLELRDASRSAARFTVRASSHEELRLALLRARTGDAPLAPLVECLEKWSAGRWRTVLTCASLSQAERLRHLLDQHGIDPRIATDLRPAWRWSRAGRVEIRTAKLSEGFALSVEKLAVVTEEEIFGPREKRRRRTRWPEGAALESLGHLATGDYLVHADHGIGIYRGLVELSLRGVDAEFLRLEYANQARLFVPVHRLNRIQRYAGSDGHAPRIDKLGGVTWEKAKKGIRKSLRNMAQELLSVHAARELTPGFAFSPRDWQRSRSRWRTCAGRRRWIGWSAETSVTARPRSPCAPPSGP